MRQKFRTGDVVRLQCGGPEMVVVNASTPQALGTCSLVSVSWIDQRGQLKTTRFPRGALLLIRNFILDEHEGVN